MGKKSRAYRCQVVQAESWDDDDFQDYYYEDGTRVPEGEDIGVELNLGDGGWKFYLLDGIFYP